MGRVTELQSFFISREMMTSVDAINHAAISSKFHSLNEITLEQEQGVSSRASLTFSAPKHARSSLANTSKQAHIHLHTPSNLCFHFPINGSLFSTANHLIIRLIQSVISGKSICSIRG